MRTNYKFHNLVGSHQHINLPEKLTWSGIHFGIWRDFRFAICLLEFHCGTAIWHCQPVMLAIANETVWSVVIRLGFWIPNGIVVSRNETVENRPATASGNRNEICQNDEIRNETGESRPSSSGCGFVECRIGNDVPENWTVNRGVPASVPVWEQLVVCRFGYDCHDSSRNPNLREEATQYGKQRFVETPKNSSISCYLPDPSLSRLRPMTEDS